MPERDEVYKISRKSLLDRMLKSQNDCAKCHEGLKHKDSKYANSIAAMRDLYTEIIAAIKSTPTT